MKRFLGTMTIVAVMLILIAIFIAPQSQATEHWKQKYVRFSATAGETVAAGDAVCIKGSDGKAYKADANDSSLRPAVGVIDKGGATGATVEIVVVGILAGQTAVSPGARLYLSETAAAITATAPTNAQAIGWGMPNSGSTSTTDYFINIVTPVSAGAGY